MCGIIKRKYVAKKDMVKYMIVVGVNSPTTIVKRIPLEVGKVLEAYGSEYYVGLSMKELFSNPKNRHSVSNGLFHLGSLRDLKNSLKKGEWYRRDKNITIFKVIIPKGTVYFTGYNELVSPVLDGKNIILSSKIMLEKAVYVRQN